MNPLAKKLNDDIISQNPNVYDMLSNTGKELFMPKGILSQSAEAKVKAKKFNATIGISTDHGKPMYLNSMFEKFNGIEPSNLFTYAPAGGVAELRDVWQNKIKEETPSLGNSAISKPVVCNALTNGLTITANLFLDKGDYVVIPDKFWGNYRLMFSTILGGEIATYPIFNDNNGYNVEGLLNKVKECGLKKKKVFIVLNFPNNPTGYSLTKDEADQIATGLIEIANSGINIVAVTDDAYYGLFFDDKINKESLFGKLTGKSDRLLAVKVDGVTKESFAWGFRVGFITYGQTVDGNNDKILNALEVKTTGFIRSTISSAPHPSQSIALASLKHPKFKEERNAWNKVIGDRCNKVHEVLNNNSYDDEFVPYPFNSGYFMCIKLLNVDAEELRLALLEEGIGVISTNATDIRIAFSSVDIENIDELFADIYKVIKKIKK